MSTEGIAISVLGAIFGIISWLFKANVSFQEREIAEIKKNAEEHAANVKAIQISIATISSQSEQIRILFIRHDDNAAGLQRLELAIAEGHYKRGELDRKFEMLDSTIQKSSETLIRKLEELSEKFYSQHNRG